MKTPSTTLRRLWPAALITALAVILPAATPPVLARYAGHTQQASHTGGSLTVDYSLPVSCLDVQKSTQGPMDPITDTLVTEDIKGHIHPGLATSWKTRAGGKQIDFTLRQGVKFSNGDPLNAAAVKASIDRARDPATKSPVAASYLGSITSTTVVSKYVVRLSFAAPYRPIFINLAGFWAGIVDAKAMNAEGDASCSNPIGTGPYKVKSTGTAFSSIVMVRNPYHNWGSNWYFNKGLPYINSITFNTVPDLTTEVSQLLSGDVDYIAGVDAANYSRVTHNSKINLIKVPLIGTYYLEFNLNRAPFDNLAVRKAISEAVNRSALSKAANGPLGFPVYGPWAPSIPFYDKTIKKYSIGYKPSAAQPVLSSHGVNGTYTLITIDYPTYTTAAELMQAELAQVGVNIKIDAVPYGNFVTDGGKLNWDLCLCAAGATDPDQILSLFFQAGGVLAWFPKNATLDALAAKGRETLNSKKAAQYYYQAQRFLTKNVWVDGLYGSYEVIALRSRLHGWQMNAFGDYPVYQSLYVK